MILGLAVAGGIRLGLALWRGADRVEALLISVVSFAFVGIGYLIFARSRR